LNKKKEFFCIVMLCTYIVLDGETFNRPLIKNTTYVSDEVWTVLLSHPWIKNTTYVNDEAWTVLINRPQIENTI
jgi:hypothetical protein